MYSTNESCCKPGNYKILISVAIEGVGLLARKCWLYRKWVGLEWKLLLCS